jgi:hypothetical protein
MRKQKKSRPKSAKGERYKVTNWSEYNRSLKKRGSITFWLSEDVCSKWYYEGQSQRGAQQEYSDTCIELCCIVRKVYHLPLRQTEGLLESIIHLAGLELKTPDYSVICRRSKKLAVQLPGKIKHGAYLDVVFDSTGLKVFGEGEWKVRQHGWGKHRTWRKVHIGADPSTGLIQAAAMSTNSITDATMVKPLLRQIKGKVKKFTGDGGYDKMKVYKRTPVSENTATAKDEQTQETGQYDLSVLMEERNGREQRIITKEVWRKISCIDTKLSWAISYRPELLSGSAWKH